MKLTNKKACLQCLTTATTAMSAVVSAQQDRDGVRLFNPKAQHIGQEHIIDQPQSNQKNPLVFNNGVSSSLTFGNYGTTTSSTDSTTTTTLSLLDSSLPHSDKVLRNKGLKPCRDTKRNQDTNNKDADIGILDCGVNEYCLVLSNDYDDNNYGIGRCVDKTFFLTSDYNHSNNMIPLLPPFSEKKSVRRSSNELQQNRRRLTDYVCPDVMPGDICPTSPFSLDSDDTLTCEGVGACEDFVVTDFAAGSSITCSARRACSRMSAVGAGTIAFTVDDASSGASVTLQQGGQLVCASTTACYTIQVPYFAAESMITCSAFAACSQSSFTGAGTIVCTARNACQSVQVTLQNGGRLTCDFQSACYTADVNFAGSAFMECLRADACVSPRQNSIVATADGGTLLCREANSCLTSFNLNDFSFLLICEDSFSCASNADTSVAGTENTCVVCVQTDSCTNLANEFFPNVVDNKADAQLIGVCSEEQIATMCNLIDPDLALTLDFGSGLVCVPSMSPSTSMAPSDSSQPSMTPSTLPTDSSQPSMTPSTIPTGSSQPSMTPSTIPTDRPQPSMIPSKKPIMGKKGGGKGKKGETNGGKKAVNGGGKKDHPYTGSGKTEIAKVENIAKRDDP